MSDSDDLKKRLRDYMTVEQEFYHTHFMSRASKIDKVDDLVEILDLLHANYLVQKRLFSSLAREAARSGIELPSIAELLQ